MRTLRLTDISLEIIPNDLDGSYEHHTLQLFTSIS